MDRQMMRAHLTVSDHDVARGRKSIADQIALIAELQRQHLNIHASNLALQTMLETQALYVAESARLRKLLA